MTADGAPGDYLPARMLNEFVYCPRLFHLEWVQDRFAESDDTRIGTRLHKVADTPSGELPDIADDDFAEIRRSLRSTTLASDRLRIIAKMDVIEISNGVAVPVDYKKGSPDSEGQPWPADVMQLAAQALVLRDNGYHVTRAELFYAEIKRRVRVELPEEVLRWAETQIAAAWQLADQISPPLPLIDSPKCPRCSLHGICLPDETNALLGKTDPPRRRLTPKDPEQRPIYVTDAGANVGVRGGRLEVRRGDEKLASFRVIDTAQLVVYGRVQISNAAIMEMFERRAPIFWMSYGGWLKGWAWSPPPGYAELRRRQTIAHAGIAPDIVNAMIAGKIKNCRTLLKRNATSCDEKVIAQLAALADRALKCERRDELLGIEGTAARLYFANFETMFKGAGREFARKFAAGGRNRRPPRDPINALLSFTYSLLVKDLVAITLAVGFDPYLGLLHRSRSGRPAFALDLAEEFRPLIADSVVLGVVNNGEVSHSDFTSRGGGVSLTRDGRRTVIAAYERRLDHTIRHPRFGYTVSYRRIMDVQARLVAATLTGELASYPPMMTR